MFDYEVPFGKGRLKYSHAAPSKLTGGWYSAGVFRRSSGVPHPVTISGQAFGGGEIFATLAGMLALVPTNTLGGGLHSGVPGETVNTPLGPVDVGTAGNPANGGAGLNYFAIQEQPFLSSAQLSFRLTLTTAVTVRSVDSASGISTCASGRPRTLPKAQGWSSHSTFSISLTTRNFLDPSP